MRAPILLVLSISLWGLMAASCASGLSSGSDTDEELYDFLTDGDGPAGEDVISDGDEPASEGEAPLPDGDLAETADDADSELVDDTDTNDAPPSDGDADGDAPPDGDEDILPDGDAEERELPDWLADARCGMTPPEGVKLAAPPPPYGGGQCPELAAGFNTLTSSGKARRFMLVLPADPQPDERYPLLFMWHWLKSKPESFYDHGEVQDAVDQQCFIAVIPASLYDINLFGLLELPWPFVNFVSQARIDEELRFFDDMLACISERFAIDKECVSTVGVSAGALWSVQLATARSQYIASLISLSGGTGVQGLSSNFVRFWSPPARKFPTLVLWGGPLDSCILLNFQDCSQELERDLIEGGHFFLECVHNCKHGEPPIDPPPGLSRYHTLWDFMFRHPYWLPEGLSPYNATGLPSDYIPWCGVGMGSAVPRVGECPPPSCPI
ncbi:MAG: hypothetical protein C4523_04910 [Myxococcales bacterium]|nr:MAG: hypothetical protein C4523_04910 [Myxococcales bacterium]